MLLIFSNFLRSFYFPLEIRFDPRFRYSAPYSIQEGAKHFHGDIFLRLLHPVQYDRLLGTPKVARTGWRNG